MMIGKDFMKNICANVLADISKETLALQGELINKSDEQAKEIYNHFLTHTKKIINVHLENDAENFKKLRNGL